MRAAAMLRPGALGYGNLPFPESVDQAWPLMLELTSGGVTTADELDAWLAALGLVPEDARARIIADEMNDVISRIVSGLMNRRNRLTSELGEYP